MISAILIEQIDDVPVPVGFGSELIIMFKTAFQCCKPLLFEDSLHISRAVVGPAVLAVVSTTLGWSLPHVDEPTLISLSPQYSQ